MYINRLEISIVSFPGIESIGCRVQVASRVFFEDYFICSFHSFLCTCSIIRRERLVTGMFTVIERFDTAGLGLVSKRWNISDTQARWDVDVLYISLPPFHVLSKDSISAI